MAKIKKLISSEGFKYLFFGGLATLLYFILKAISWQALKSGWASETISQAICIVFAFITNKIWVFNHKSDNVWKDFLSFTSQRIVLMLFAVIVNKWFVDMHPEILMKFFGFGKNEMVAVLSLALQIFTIAVNYIYSKFVVFKNKKPDPV